MTVHPEILELYTLFQSGHWASAETAARMLVAREPANLFGWKALGAVLQQTSRPAEAAECYKKALTLNPDDEDSLVNLGQLLGGDGQFALGMACVRKALQANPHSTAGLTTLGELLCRVGRVQEALSCFRTAADHGSGQACQRLLFTLLYVAPEALRPEAERYGRLLAAQARPFTRWHCATPVANGPFPRPLRVALLSGDLYDHAVSHFLRAVLPKLDTSRIRLLAFSSRGEAQEDAISAELKRSCAEWHTIGTLSDEQAAALLHSRGVHMALDLCGHSRDTRLPVLAWRPAPVQAAWCAFATSGLAAVDAVFADADSLPPEAEAHFTEAVVRLPTRLCFAPPPAIAVQPLPALRIGVLTFGCFQNMEKLRPPMLQLWQAILQALPTARLRIQNAAMRHASLREALAASLAAMGMDLSRVELAGPAPRMEYLQAYNEVDCCLDTFPYTGCTTSCEALWMGVPTVTLAGNTLVSRQGVSLLRAVGLDDWIAASPAHYVDIAVQLGGRIAELAELRAHLRERFMASPVLDADAYARQFTAALEQLWQRFGAKRLAESGLR